MAVTDQHTMHSGINYMLVRQAPMQEQLKEIINVKDLLATMTNQSTCQVDIGDHEDHLEVSLLLHVYVASQPGLIQDTCNKYTTSLTT